MIKYSLCIALAVATFTGPAQAQETAFATFDVASEPVLDDPHDLAIGPSGLLYVADKFANRIAVLDPETLEVVGSFGDGALFGVHDISFAPDGRVLSQSFLRFE